MEYEGNSFKGSAALMYRPFYFTKLSQHQPLFIVNQICLCKFDRFKKSSATDVYALMAYLHYNQGSCDEYTPPKLQGALY